MLRVALCNFHNRWGGQAAYVLVLARQLAATGQRVLVACPPGSDLAERAGRAGLEVYTGCTFLHGFQPVGLIREARALGGLLQGFDIVHSHGSQDCWRAALACRFCRPGCRHVRTKHNSYPVESHLINRWLFRKGIDRLVVVAEALKPLVADLIPPERIDVLHAPVGDRFFEPHDGSGFRTELGIGPEVPLVGVVGRLVPDKGQSDLLRALVELRPRFPRILAVLVGQGTDRPRLEALAAELGVAEQVRFLGPRTDIPEITAALDVSVLPSTDCDASSTVVKEALALGRPVVATEVGGIREIVEDGVTGTIVPPARPAELAAAIARMLAAPEQARSMAAAGRETCRRRFSEAAFVAGQLDIYHRVLAVGARASG